MDRELAGALTDLGLSATEAQIYVALLRLGGSGPVSAYRLAQEMGRDPANLTKALAVMARRGAVRASGRRPRLFAAVAPEEFTGRLIARLQDRQQQALELLRDIGEPPPDQDLHALPTCREAFAVARRLIAGARRVVLCDGASELLGGLAEPLSAAATTQGAMVLVLCPTAISLPGARVRQAGGLESRVNAAPGPWLRLAVDGHASLEMLAHPADRATLLHGHWSLRPAQAFLSHRNLASAWMLADLEEQLREGIAGESAWRRAADQASLLLHQLGWRQLWREAGLPDWAPAGAPAGDAAAAPDPDAKAGQPQAADQPGPPAAAAAAAGEQPEPLQFVHRRRRS